MSIQSAVSDVLLAIAVLVVLASSLGIWLMDDLYQKLHFVAPISVVAPFLVAVAVTVREGARQATAETWLALLLVMISSPFLSHATVRAARIRDRGDWRV